MFWCIRWMLLRLCFTASCWNHWIFFSFFYVHTITKFGCFTFYLPIKMKKNQINIFFYFSRSIFYDANQTIKRKNSWAIVLKRIKWQKTNKFQKLKNDELMNVIHRDRHNKNRIFFNSFIYLHLIVIQFVFMHFGSDINLTTWTVTSTLCINNILKSEITTRKNFFSFSSNFCVVWFKLITPHTIGYVSASISQK